MKAIGIRNHFCCIFPSKKQSIYPKRPKLGFKKLSALVRRLPTFVDAKVLNT